MISARPGGAEGWWKSSDLLGYPAGHLGGELADRHQGQLLRLVVGEANTEPVLDPHGQVNECERLQVDPGRAERGVVVDALGCRSSCPAVAR
jgi:hypothetical protein